MATITINFEKQQNTDIPEDQLNYITKVSVEGGIPLQVAINSLVQYLDKLIQYAEQQKNNIQLEQSKTDAENTRDGSINNSTRPNNEHENTLRKA